MVIIAEKPGLTILTGKSTLAISGEWIVVEGLWFKDPTPQEGTSLIEFRTSSSRPANNCLLRGCAVTGDGHRLDMTESKWVSLYGANNRVTGCTFLDKANMGALLVVWFEKDIVPCHIIEGNRFSRPRSNLDEKGECINGQETIRIGTSHFSMQNGRCIVRNNFFEDCNGEVEIISNKTCENIYSGNVFTNCIGTLTLRHGNRCTVKGNRFFGTGAKSTGGVRIIGFDHKITDNFFHGLTGTNYYSAICAVQGEKDSALNGYFAAKDVEIARNTIVNCRTGITINSRTSRQTLPVERLHIHDNVVMAAKESDKTVVVNHYPESPVELRWEDNIFSGGSYEGISPSEAGIKTGGINWDL